MPFYLSVQKEMMQPCDVLFMRRVGAYGPENHKLMNHMKAWVQNQRLWEQQTTLLGIPWDNPFQVKAEECRYDVCMIWDKKMIPQTDEVTVGQIDGGLYAVFWLEHTAEAVQAVWREYSTVLFALGYVLDNTRPAMERYQKKLVDQHLCELCVPILE